MVDAREFLTRVALADATVDNGDDTWSYVLDPDFDTETRLFDGVVTWRYDRQAAMPYEPKSGGLGEQTFLYHDLPPSTPREQLMATEFRDPDGRVWVAEHVVESPDLDIAAPYVPDPEALPDGELVQWTPASWSLSDCDGNGRNDNWVWDAEDRVVVNAGASPNRRSIVRIDREDGWGTGVLLRDEWVLTAAHVLWDGNTETFVDYADVSIVRLHDGETRAVWFWHIGPGFDGGPNGWDPDDDYAIIRLSTPYTNADTMNISNADNAALNAVGANFHRLGQDRWTGSCEVHGVGANHLLHTANNDITAKTSTLVRWKGDAAQGASGGPLYYCPENDVTVCTGDEVGYVVGVFAGYSGYYSRLLGARGSNFFGWATALMNAGP